MKYASKRKAEWESEGGQKQQNRGLREGSEHAKNTTSARKSAGI
jgi:hypothetical protein